MNSAKGLFQMSKKHLFFYLDAPMQAWGHSSRFNRRTSASWPVKSGVVGMLCAAMGIERDNEEDIARLADLSMTVYTLHNGGQRLTDYHTVGGGYDSNSHPHQFFDSKNGQSIAVLTDREYLLDCKFGVILTGDAETIEQCATAIQNPKWGVWFGRKCCLPAARIFEGIFDTEEQAKERLLELAQQLDLKLKPWRTITEAETFEDGTDSLMDIPLNFATREYKTRRIADEYTE